MKIIFIFNDVLSVKMWFVDCYGPTELSSEFFPNDYINILMG